MILLFLRSTVFGINRYSLAVQVVLGSVICLSGLTLMAITIRMFILIGRGTFAPWDPTTKLVTGGIYAHVRNPMISGVLIVLLGGSVLFGSLGIFIWAVLFFVGNTVYFRLSEEKGLEKRFGREYVEYRKNVPMWIPRLRPWSGGDSTAGDDA